MYLLINLFFRYNLNVEIDFAVLRVLSRLFQMHSMVKELFIPTESVDLGIPTANSSTKLGVLPKPNTV